MTKRRLILVGENQLFREGLTLVLESDAITVVGAVSCFRDLPALLRSTTDQSPDLILYDQPENAAQDFEPLMEVAGEFPRIGIIILADQVDSARLDLAVSAKVRGFLPKGVSSAALSISLQLLALDENLFMSPTALFDGRSPILEAPMLSDSHELRAPLSTRECEILQCLEVGSPNKVIARKLNMAEATVKVHIKSVLRKIYVDNRTQAAVWAMNHKGYSPNAIA